MIPDLWRVMQADHDLVWDQIWPRLDDHPTDPDADLLAARWVDAPRRGQTHPRTRPVPWILGTHGYVGTRIDRAREALTGRKVPAPSAISDHRSAVQR